MLSDNVENLKSSNTATPIYHSLHTFAMALIYDSYTLLAHTFLDATSAAVMCTHPAIEGLVLLPDFLPLGIGAVGNDVNECLFICAYIYRMIGQLN